MIQKNIRMMMNNNILQEDYLVKKIFQMNKIVKKYQIRLIKLIIIKKKKFFKNNLNKNKKLLK